MNFHGARPDGFSDLDSCIQEVRAGIQVVFAGLQYPDRLTLNSGERGALQQFHFPQVVKKFFGHGFSVHGYHYRVYSLFIAEKRYLHFLSLLKTIQSMKLKSILLTGFVCIFFQASAQQPTDPTMNGTVVSDPHPVSTYVEEMPQFPGGEQALMQFLSDNIQYPKKEARQGIQGKAVVRFVVNEDGMLSDFAIARSLGGAFDREVLRVVQLMPDWIPGKQNGEAVKVYFMLPVSFKLAE